MKNSGLIKNIPKHYIAFFCLAIFFAFLTFSKEAEAATLRLSPGTGVYAAGSTFTARIMINTEGQSVNAAEGRLSFNPREVTVANVSRSTSIFNLWTVEPTYSNTAGTITFGGGSPSGYSGSNGTVMTVTFRALNAGSPRVTFESGSVLAADGLGTNVLTSMNGASYTINAFEVNPEPEYIAPANTPAAPEVTSVTHPNPDGWSKETTAELSWQLPGDVVAVRTLLDESPGTIPTILYEEPINSRVVEDLDEGVSYFHVQFRNENGWGKVTHYRLGVDTEKPSEFTITQPEDQNPASPEQTVIFNVEDISPITRYIIQLNGGEPVEFNDIEGIGAYTFTDLVPGRHTIIVEAFDSAENSLISTYAFDVASFDRPVFTDYPTRLNEGVIPALRGSTRPSASLLIVVARTEGETIEYQITSDENGAFVFIPDTGFSRGVYDITAVATDEFGAQSEPSETVRIVVEEPGYIKIGSFVVSLLSLIIPLVALVILLIIGSWYLWHRFGVWRRKIEKETAEVEEQLAREFAHITKNIENNVKKLSKSRKGRLTKAEQALLDELESDVKDAKRRIEKEISDIESIVE